MSRYPHGGTKGDAIISGSIHWSPVLFLGSKGIASTSPAPSKTTSHKYQYNRHITHLLPRNVILMSVKSALPVPSSALAKGPTASRWVHLAKHHICRSDSCRLHFWRLIGSAMFSLTFTRYQNSSQGTPQSARSHTDRILGPGHNAAPIGAQGNGDFIGRSQLPRKVVDPTFAHLKNGRGLKLTWFSLQFTIFSNGWCFVLPLASTNCLFRLCLLWPV